jgi:ketosteroid isomerase-like protein
MIRGLFIAATLVALLVQTGTARADLREEIEAANVTFVSHYAAKHGEALAGLYTAGAKVMPPGVETVSGREAIAVFWQGTIDAGLGLMEIETLDVEAVQDTAYERGLLHLRNPDGSEITSKYVVVWKRVGGAWQLHLDIWN